MDNFLLAHTLRPGIFSLGDRAPISIRDQIVRAHLLTDSLFRTSILSRGKKLLIAGAGIAGASAAILAARRGARVWLCDPNEFPFSVQSRCHSRWIDPVQYDWPRAHSRRGIWPITGITPSVPFGFKAELSHKLASHWRDELEFESALDDVELHLWNFATVRDRPKKNGLTLIATIDVSAPKFDVTADFDAIIFARGAKNEITSVPLVAVNNGHVVPIPGKTFEGVKFWSTDEFQSPDLGLQQYRRGAIFISGGGDGALQDYIRLVTGKNSALEVLKVVLNATDEPKKWADMLARGLAPREEQAHRSMLWSSDRLRGHAILSELHQHYVNQVSSWPRVWLQQNAKVIDALRILTTDRNPERIFLVHECSHFGDSFALNRFVALVLIQFVTLTYGVNPVFPNSAVRAVAPYHLQAAHVHQCKPGCWDERHQVFIERGVTCESPQPQNSPNPHDAFGIVIRHGIDSYSNARLARDSLPLHLLSF